MVSLFLCPDMSSFWRAFTKLPILLAHLVALPREPQLFFIKMKEKKENKTFDTKLILLKHSKHFLLPLLREIIYTVNL